MKNPFLSLLLLIVIACNKESTSINYETQVADVVGVSSSLSPISAEGLYFENIRYGEQDRQFLDLLLPSDGAPKGVVVYFHGGGFTGGDKSDIASDYIQPIMNSLLENGLAIVSANYTLLSTSGSQGVISALEDGSLVVNYVRSHLDDFNLPTNAMVLAGVSAGAGIAQWNGFQESTNDQVQGMVALAAQSTYNLYEWENVFPGLSLDTLRTSNALLNQLFLGFYGGTPTQELLNTLDYRAFIDANDPPIYVYNTLSDEVISPLGELDIDVLYHSIRHSDYIRSKAIEEELPFSGAYQEGPEEFVFRVLR